MCGMWCIMVWCGMCVVCIYHGVVSYVCVYTGVGCVSLCGMYVVYHGVVYVVYHGVGCPGVVVCV